MLEEATKRNKKQQIKIDRLRDISTDLLEALEGLIEVAQAVQRQADEALLNYFWERAPAAQVSYDSLTAAIKIANAATARANEEFR